MSPSGFIAHALADAIASMSKLGELLQEGDYWFMNTGDDGSKQNRAWEDCKAYGFVIAGGSPQYVEHVQRLAVGDKVFAYLSGHGYVGFGHVIASAVPQNIFVPSKHSQRLIDLPHVAEISNGEGRTNWDWCAGVHWVYAVDAADAVCKELSRRPTAQAIRQPGMIEEVLAAFRRQAIQRLEQS